MIVNSHLQSACAILHAARAFTIYRNQCSRSPEYAETITYIDQGAVQNAMRFVKQNPDATQKAVWHLFLQQKFFTNNDSTRRQLARAVQSVGGTLTPLVDVEDIETALDIAATGRADAITARGLLKRMGDRVPPNLRWVSLRPKVFDEFAIVVRRDVPLSKATQVVIELAIARMQAIR